MWLYCLPIIFLLALWYLRNYIRLVILALKLPGPKVVPILGNVLLINDSKALKYYGNNAPELYGSTFRVWISLLPVIIVYKPEHIKIILSTTKISEKNLFYAPLRNFLGSGMVTNTGYAWHKNRKLVQPYFSLSEIERSIGLFYKGSKELLQQIEPEKDVKISDLINNVILSTLYESVLGNSFDLESPFRKVHSIFFHRVSKPWLLINSFFKLTSLAEREMTQTTNLFEFTHKVLLKRLEDRKKLYNKQNPNCLLEDFIEISENNPEFTHEDIIKEACTFMLAGQDTVASATVFTLYLLAKHKVIQDNVMNEQKIIFNNNNLDEITMDQLNQMKYLEMCIKESLRLYPSIPIISRVLKQDVELDEYVLPSGTNVIISFYTAHRLSSVFPEPFKFNPERFRQDKHPYTFFPFSAGPRNCIGYKFGILEMKTFISAIVRNYELFLCPGKEEVELLYRVTLRAKGGLWLRCKKRTL